MKQNKRRAFNAAINAEWAMERAWIDRLLEIAVREHAGLRAVEAERGEPLEYTRTVEVRNGVAIIPIEGPIFRYANLFSYYSGGTSVEVLARDFHAALNSPKVDAIIFEVNSPGGEVTGINELANMIFAARGKKPMTARVGGYGCSAAYWLLSACGDVVIDETAPLGSIGVYAAFIDFKKADAKNGIREFKIISSQSPDKCPDPATPEGEKKIQARIDTLAQIFIEAVARNRDVSVETVLNDFGKGDVLIGQDAIDVGMADRLGSFEATLAELATAYGIPGQLGYTGALHPEQPLALIVADNLSQEEDLEENPEEDPNEPCNDPEEENENEAARTTAQSSLASPHHPVNKTSAQPPAIQKGAIQMADENKSAGTANSKQPTIEELQALLAAQTARAEQSEAAQKQLAERTAALEKDARMNRYREAARAFSGDMEKHVTMMEFLGQQAGEDSDIFKGYVEQQQAAATQIEQGKLFAEAGSSAAVSADSPYGKLMAAAQKIAADNNLSIEQAFVKACEVNPSLYNQYVDEQQKGAN